MRVLLLSVLVLVGCGKNPCEQAHEHVSECLGVSYTADERDQCASPATPSNFVCSTGKCEGLAACESECFLDTSCDWIEAAFDGETVHGLNDCLDRCWVAN